MVAGIDGGGHFVYYYFIYYAGAKADQRQQARFGEVFYRIVFIFAGYECRDVFYLCYYTFMGWMALSFRRVSEAISVAVAVIGVISILSCLSWYLATIILSISGLIRRK
jgi:hypothetical protein